MREGWKPEMISGRAKLEGRPLVSKETKEVIESITDLLNPLPEVLKGTVTLDNSKELRQITQRIAKVGLVRRVLKSAKRFYGIASFRYYAIADGIAYILRRLGKGPIIPHIPVVDDKQLTFYPML